MTDIVERIGSLLHPDVLNDAVMVRQELLNEAANEILLLRAALWERGSNVTESLVHELRDRDARGRVKYGVTLDRRDLTPDQWAQHLLEELLDAAGYVQALRREMRGEAENKI